VFGIAAASVAGPLAAANGSWSTTGPYGGSVRLVTVYEASPSTLWAAGNGGVFRSTSSGASWDRVEIGLPAATPIQDFVAASATPVLYLTNGQRIYRSGNGGDLWVTLGSLPTSGYVSDLSLRRATSNSIAVATHDGAYVSSNGGGSWTGPGAGGTSARFSKIEYAADGSLYLGIEYSDPGAFGGAVLLKSTNAGASWTPLATQPPGMFGIALLASSPSDPQRIFATDGYTIATSSDGGTSWAGISQPGTGAGCNQLLSLTPHPTQPLALFVGCSNNGVHFTTNVSAPVWTSWTAASGLSVNGNDPVQSASIAVHPAYATTPTVFVGASDGGLFRSTNAGAAWTVINQGYQSANIRALATHPRDTSNAIVLAGYGDAFTTSRAIYKSPNSGITWDPSTDGLKAEQIRSISIDPTTVDTDPFTAENFTVYAAGRSERLPTIADKDGGIYKSSDAGANWTTIDNGIAMVSGVRDMGTVRTIALDPRSCAAPPASGPCAIGSGPLQTLFAAGGGRVDFSGSGLPYLSARIYKSTNAGTTWSPSETGLPLSQDLGPAGQSNYAYMGGIVPLVFDPSNTQTIYIGSFLAWSPGIAGAAEPTIANGVFKSTNGGASWIHASEGLPRYAGVASSHRDVLALAINPANPQVLYAGAVDLYSSPLIGRVYKTINGGATWSESSTGISGQDVRALFIDPADPSGDTIYAGTGGDGANPGGVYRSTNGGATWNSFSLGLPAYAATALAMPARAPGAAARILAGTNSGVWDYTAVPDEDADGVPSAMENSVLGGDGNGDGILDSQQSNVASFAALASTSGTQPNALTGTQVNATVSIVPGSCTQLNDISSLQANLFPPDPVGDVTSHDPWGLVSFSLPGCSAATVRVTFHGASFGPGWTWRNYGPRIPGDDASFGWYTFAGARRIDTETWELAVDAARQGNYRRDAHNILFIGGPGNLPDLLFGNGFE
jgi:photosystem II stability/assembly factor-like uncharacterized protein